jgi:HEPN domain-containing protein
MNDAKRELIQDWLTKAQQDLLSSQKLISGDDPLYGVALYHCQQAVEKALKGLLVFHDRRFGKTHDLRILLTLALSVEPKLSPLTGTLDRLTDYATVFRCPGGEIDPEQSEYESGFARAELLPADAHP